MMLTPIIVLSCALWRWVDGRDWRLSGWNVVLFVGYGYACSLLPYETHIQVLLFALAMINILSGFDTFTLPWFKYKIALSKLILKHHNLSVNATEGMRLVFMVRYKREAKALKAALERDYGFNTWHTAYRFLPPVLIACAFTQWDWTWVLLTVHAGYLFPATEFLKVPYREHLRESYLGLIVLGGPFVQVALNIWGF